MAEVLTHKPEKQLPEFLAGGGEMGELIRSFNWASTEIGPVESWPQNLRTCIRIMLTSRQPIWIGWGKKLIKFYNDPYKSIVGGKHPWALGQPASVVWKDIWKDIEPMLRSVMENDEGTYVESQLLIMERNGYPEETYYTFSYTPIPGDSGETAGMICANTNDTDRIISERQLKTLTELAKNLNDTIDDNAIIRKTILTLEQNTKDFPFVLFYRIDDDRAVLSDQSAFESTGQNIPHEITLEDEENDISVQLSNAVALRKQRVITNLASKFGNLPRGGWNRPPDSAIIIPVSKNSGADAYGFFIIGLNPYRLLNDEYTSLFSLFTDQVEKSFVKIHALEEERKRVEALAEIDRAKTTFFSNISHEFRTPLTLLLGPISDALSDQSFTAENRERLQVVYRNALRMQKLVNTLLDFSKIEAGRLDAMFTQVDICRVTTELASTFQSAIEKAGLTLTITCGEITDEVFVDLDMWEKIVLNLVSNAFKYSKAGVISVHIEQQFNKILFSVSDQGIGIPADQLEKIFDRFHRVENVNGRSEEGTGIGLSLVRELVRLHSGNISVKSRPGYGATFTVAIPAGKAHLEASRIFQQQQAYSVKHSDAFIQEALKWIPEEVTNTTSTVKPQQGTLKEGLKPTVLLADDNQDMRNYVQRLLSSQFNVVSAINGEDAFQKTLVHLPDLVLSDIMMPVLNGFQLLEKIRANNATKNLPVIFLSARAGEEAKIEGLSAGADDYLVKPFTARELIARVEANIKIAKNRQASELNFRSIIMQAPVAMATFKGDDLILEIANTSAIEIWGKPYKDIVNKPYRQVFKESADLFGPFLEQVYKTGNAFSANEQATPILKNGKLETVYMNFVVNPLIDKDGKITGLITAGIDVTANVNAKKAIEKSEQELNELANAMPQLVWIADQTGKVTYYNNRISEFAGATRMPDGNWLWEGLVHADDLEKTVAAWNNAVATGNDYQVEHRITLKDGSHRWYLSRGIPNRDKNGVISKWFGTATDIHVAKEYANILEQQVQQRTFELQEMNKRLQQSNDDLQQFAHVASHDLKEPLRKIKTYAGRLAEDEATLISAKGSQFLSKMNSATDRMFSMIEGVLRYSTVNEEDDAFEAIDLNTIFSQIVTDLELLAKEKNASYSIQDLPVVQGAGVLIYQLFYNLINNALKFSSTERKPIISVYSSTTNLHDSYFATINIEDNGIGFENEHADKIFDPFARLNSKDKYEGTGLGLALCKKIVQRHNGSIIANSKKNKGTTFTVCLPVKQV